MDMMALMMLNWLYVVKRHRFYVKYNKYAPNLMLLSCYAPNLDGRKIMRIYFVLICIVRLYTYNLCMWCKFLSGNQIS